ncbi:MAG: hypothetical protein ACQETQ_11945 [Spirochaetota bacterium]
MQKRAFRVLVVVAAVTFALLPSCDTATNSDSSSDSGSDGTGAGPGISYVAGGQQYVFTENLAAGYTPAEDETCVVGSDYPGASAHNAVHIYFPGNAAGTFSGPPDPDPTTGLPRIGILIDSTEYYGWQDGKGCWFTIEATTYGPVGGRIEGTFSGKLFDTAGDTTIELTDGAFSVRRYN